MSVHRVLPNQAQHLSVHLNPQVQLLYLVHNASCQLHRIVTDAALDSQLLFNFDAPIQPALVAVFASVPDVSC